MNTPTQKHKEEVTDKIHALCADTLTSAIRDYSTGKTVQCSFYADELAEKLDIVLYGTQPQGGEPNAQPIRADVIPERSIHLGDDLQSKLDEANADNDRLAEALAAMDADPQSERALQLTASALAAHEERKKVK